MNHWNLFFCHNSGLILRIVMQCHAKVEHDRTATTAIQHKVKGDGLTFGPALQVIAPAPCDPALYQSLIIIISKSAKRRSKHRRTLPPPTEVTGDASTVAQIDRMSSSRGFFRHVLYIAWMHDACNTGLYRGTREEDQFFAFIRFLSQNMNHTSAPNSLFS